MNIPDITRKVIAMTAGITFAGWSKTYDGAYQEFIHSYAWDAAAPIVMYNLLSRDFSRRSNGTWAFAVPALYETIQGLAQLLDHPMGHGRFDPWDYVAYATGALAAVGIDTLSKNLERIKKCVD